MGGVTVTNAVGGWTKNVKASSTVPFNESDMIPKEITKGDIQEVKNFWLLALTSLPPTSAQISVTVALKPDFLSLDIDQLTRDAVRPDIPVFLRVSATDWLEHRLPDGNSWKLEDIMAFPPALAVQCAINTSNISSGGVHVAQKVTSSIGFLVPFATAAKKAVGDKIYISAMDDVDVILIGLAKDLDTKITMAAQIHWGFTGFRNASEYIQPILLKASIFD